MVSRISSNDMEFNSIGCIHSNRNIGQAYFYDEPHICSYLYHIRNAQPLINDSHGGLVVRCYGGCGWKMSHLKFVAGMRNLECDEGLIGAFFIAFVRQNRAQ